ncbi:MAG: complex I NDUFA9 subunit family protein [Nitrospirota bacterium]
MILVTGANGFVGRHLISSLLQTGARIRAFVRSYEKGAELQKKGCDLSLGDIKDKESIERALDGITTVYHLIGIRREIGRDTFEEINYKGTKNLVDVMRAKGVGRLVFLSIVKVSPDSKSRYLLSKWRAEEAIRSSSLKHTIFRSTVIYGPGGESFTNLANIVRTAPIIPVIGSGRYLMQPLYVKDLVSVLVRCLENDQTINETFEIGGPEAMEFDRVLDEMAQVFGKKRIKLHLPVSLTRLFLALGEKIVPASLLPLTNDELDLLLIDTICNPDIVQKRFNISLAPFLDGLKETFLN